MLRATACRAHLPAMRACRLLLPLALLLAPSLLGAQLPAGYHWQLLYRADDSLVYQLRVDRYALDTLSDTYRGVALVSPRIAGAYEDLKVGTPALPWISLRVDGVGENPRVHLLESDFRPLAQMPVRPSYGALSANARRDTLTFRYGPAYVSSSPYPASPVAVGSSFNFRGTLSSSLRLCPFRFVGRGDLLSLSRTTTVAIAWDAHPATHRPPRTQRPSEPGSHTPLQGAQGNGSAQMLVVVPEELQGALTSYLHFKRMQGLQVEVLPFGAPGSPLPVHDTTTLKAAIQARYQAHPQLRYILLLGDFQKLPSLRRQSYGGGSESDVAYGRLAGADAVNDVYVGRLPARTPDELSMMLKRTIYYESQLPTTDTWPLASLAVASAELGTGYANRTDAQHARYLLDILSNGGFPQGQLLTPPNSASNVPTEQVVEAVESGRGTLFYVGHGVQTGWLTSSLFTPAVLQLRNLGRCPIIFSASCDNGIPTPAPSFAEAWLQVPQGGGALAFTGASDQIYWVEPMRAQEAIAQRLAMGSKWHRALTLGELFYEGTKAMLLTFPNVEARLTANVWNLFGDPTLRVQCAPSTALSAKSMLSPGPTERYYMVQGLPDSTCVTVCVRRQHTAVAYVSAYVRQGVACVPLPDLQEDDTLEVMAYHANARPWHQEAIPVRSASQSRIEFEVPLAQRILEDSQGVPLPEPLVKLQLGYRNAGHAPIPAGTQVQAWLADRAGYKLTPIPATLPELPVGGVGSEKLEFTFPASVAAKHQGRLTLELVAFDDQHVLGWLRMPLIVAQNDFFLASSALLRDGNADGQLSAGESATLALRLHYRGQQSQTITRAELTIAGEPTIAIPAKALGGPFAPRDQRTLEVALRLSTPHPAGALIPCALHLWSSLGAEELHTFLLPYGMPYAGQENITPSYPFATQEGLLSCRFEESGHALVPREGKLRAIALDVWNPTPAPMALGTVWTQVRELTRNGPEEDDYLSLEQLGQGQEVVLQPGRNQVELAVEPFLLHSTGTYDLTIYSRRAIPEPRYTVGQEPCERAPSWAGYNVASNRTEAKSLDYRPRCSYVVELPFEVEVVAQGPAGTADDSLFVRYDGHLQALNAEGRARLSVYAGVQGLHFSSQFYRDTVIYLPVSPNQTHYTVNLRLPPTTPRLLVVYGSHGARLAHAKVAVQGAPAVYTNPQGEAYLELPNGAYQLLIEASGYYPLHTALRLTKQQAPPVPYTLERRPHEPAIHCYPMPADEYTYVQARVAFDQAALLSPTGGLIQLSNYPQGYGCQLSTASLPTGIYLLLLLRNGLPVASTKLMVLKSHAR